MIGARNTEIENLVLGSKKNQRPLGGVQMAYGELEVLLKKVGGLICVILDKCVNMKKKLPRREPKAGK